MLFCKSKDDPCTSENAPSGIRDDERGKVVLLLLLLLDEELEEEEDDEDDVWLEVDEVTFVDVIVEVPVALLDVVVTILERL